MLVKTCDRCKEKVNDGWGDRFRLVAHTCFIENEKQFDLCKDCKNALIAFMLRKETV